MKTSATKTRVGLFLIRLGFKLTGPVRINKVEGPTFVAMQPMTFATQAKIGAEAARAVRSAMRRNI